MKRPAGAAEPKATRRDKRGGNFSIFHCPIKGIANQGGPGSGVGLLDGWLGR
jgi:hypothetical protein